MECIMFEREKTERFFEYISRYREVVLLGHVNPDGDSIGSIKGMEDFLINNGLRAGCVVPNSYPDFLSFLDTEKNIQIYNKDKEEAKETVKRAELIICLDFNSFSRIDELGEITAASAAPKVLIDHHTSPDTIFDLIFSDTAVSSTCELVYLLLEELRRVHQSLAPLSHKGESALYTGIMTDTNVFSNSVRPATFRIASELMERGVDKTAIQQIVFGGFSEQRMRLLGYMLHENMRIIPEHKAAMMILDNATKERFRFNTGDSEGFVNMGLNIKGIEISALFTEDDGFVRVSLRSRGDFFVNEMAGLYFNGGGHKNAAGGRLYIPISQVEAYFAEALEKYRHRI